MSQRDLKPFLPGEFMTKWFRLFEEASPDTAQEHVNELKILGSIVLNTAVKAMSNVSPIFAGNGLLLLTGKRRSRKSWVTAIVEALANASIGLIRVGSPEFMAEELSEKRVGIITANEAGEIVQNASNRGYMATWGYLINRLYMLEGIQMGRRKSKSIFIRGREYYASLLMNALDEDISGMFQMWRGLERRFLCLRFKTAPPRAWIPRDLKAFPEMAELLNRLSRYAVVIRYGEEHVERAFNPLGEALEKRAKTETEWLMMTTAWEYAQKLLMALLVDWTCHQILSVPIGGRSEGEIEGEDGISIRFYDISKVTDLSDRSIPSIYLPIDPMTLSNLGVKFVLELSPPVDLTVRTVRSLSDLSVTGVGQLVTVSMSSGFEYKLASRVSGVMELLEDRGAVTLRELMRGPLKGLSRDDVWKRVVSPLEMAGEVKTFRWKRGRVYIVSKDYPCCLNCKHLTVSLGSQSLYECGRGRDFADLDFNLTKKCDEFEFGGED